jgi:hypothetical protein
VKIEAVNAGGATAPSHTRIFVYQYPFFVKLVRLRYVMRRCRRTRELVKRILAVMYLGKMKVEEAPPAHSIYVCTYALIYRYLELIYIYIYIYIYYTYVYIYTPHAEHMCQRVYIFVHTFYSPRRVLCLLAAV